MNRISCALLVLALPTGTLANDIQSVVWTSKQTPGLNKTTDLVAQAEKLVHSLVPDSDIDPARVGDAYFADLDGDGKLELLATLDGSGRGFYTTVIVIKQAKEGFSYTTASSNGISIDGLPNHIRDVDKDGKQELILKQYIDRYEGSTPAPTEVVVLAWNGAKFVDASDKYPSYYRTVVLPPLQAKLAQSTIGGSTRSSVDDYQTFVLKAEVERAKRRAKVK